MSHDKTGESMILQGRGLALGADDEGQAFIESEESAPKWVCDILRYSIYEGGEGVAVVVRWKDPDGEAKTYFRLDRLGNMVEQLSVLVPVGACKTLAPVSLEVSPLARCGFRAHFHLHSLYNALGLEKAEHPSIWVHKRMEGWISGLQKAQLSGQLAKPLSEHHKGNKRRLAGEVWRPAPEVCSLLSRPSVTPCGLFFLVLQWGWKSQARGGLGEATDQEAARSLFSSLCVALPRAPWHLDLALCSMCSLDGIALPLYLSGHARVAITVSEDQVATIPELPVGLTRSQAKFFEEQAGWVANQEVPVDAFVSALAEACAAKG